ncbi:MAG: tRNA pseudouridine(38-40) synthase TruA [Flavobacteriales bacterium]
MNRFFAEISYDGTLYHGWQSQPNAHTVQEEIELKLGQLFGLKKIDITGCGRTDTGVHASQYFFHFDTSELPFDESTLSSKLNKMLPFDITVHRIFSVPNEAHARFNATARTYKYSIHQKKNPFNRFYSWHNPSEFDVQKMNESCTVLFKHKDFTSFSKLNSGAKTNTCQITQAKWEIENNNLIFTITADRFLRNMVRAIVGTLLQVGRGKININEMENIILSKNRCDAGESVPAHGLTLHKIEYPFID